MRISLRQLSVFGAIARHESVSRGAADVSLTQSAASMALRDLEKALGVCLFHRNGRRLLLNDHGRRLQPKARALLDQASEIERLSVDVDEKVALRIAATDIIADYVLGPICAKFLDIHPNATITVDVSNWRGVVAKTETMTCDIGFTDTPRDHDALIFEPFLTDQTIVFAAPDHPLANSESVDIRALGDERWCMRCSDGDGRRQLAFNLSLSPADISVAFESNSSEAVKAAVREGHGLGCMSHRALTGDFAARLLVPLKVRGLSLHRVFGMLRHPNNYRGVLQEQFSALLLTMLGSRDVERASLSAPERDWSAANLLQPHAA